jgi:hypothetical protein
MKRLLVFILILASSLALRANDATVIAEVKAADDARVAAMTAADASQLDAILSDELHYAHSAVLVENKAEHIDTLVSRRLIYRKIEYKTRDFRVVAPGVVVCTGRALVEVGGRRMIFLVDINFLGVWRLEKQRWRFYAWQSSRNEAPTPLGPSAEAK